MQDYLAAKSNAKNGVLIMLPIKIYVANCIPQELLPVKLTGYYIGNFILNWCSLYRSNGFCYS